MRAVVIVFLIVLTIVFVGGAVNIGGAPIFAHIDRVLGTSLLMRLHSSLFFFLYDGDSAVRQGVTGVKSDFKEFEERPLGFDKKKTYRELDKAADY
jgi:hypothetical protein